MVLSPAFWQSRKLVRGKSSSVQYHFRNCTFDEQDGRLSQSNGAPATTLRPQVARLLAAFLSQPGQVLDREHLCAQVWESGTVIDFESGLAAVLRELRKALAQLGCPPDLIETIPRRGYRLNLDPGEVTHAAVPVAAGPRGQSRWRSMPSATAIALALLLVAVIWWWPESTQPPEGPMDSYSLAILPFEQFSGHDRPPEHAGLLIADYLLAELGQQGLDGVALIGRTSLQAYAGREDVAAAVAADLGVNLLIEGSIMASDDGWRVDVRLLEIPPGRVVWSELLFWPGEPALPVADSARQIADNLRSDWSMR
jgi:DNA-binding winged helix-turn-helix (wHTH) protein/TolB-like protein